MAAILDLQRLTDALVDYTYAFLITVGGDNRPHTVMVTPVLADGTLDVGEVGDKTAANIAGRDDVTVLWPPSQPGGYALMVDGRAEPSAAGLRVIPVKALLHRKAHAGSPAAETGCLHDCVVFKA
jgi:hypothetical protein